MLNQKLLGEKLRNHRKNLGMTQEEAAEKIGVSAQAISKWEAGDCLPDCFNLKTIGDVYKISIDVLLNTETDDDVDAAADKIEQIGTELIWAKANVNRYADNLHKELGDDLWKMWKGLYFAEIGNRKLQKESKADGNLRINGDYGMKVWDDDGIVCVVQSALVKGMEVMSAPVTEVMTALCTGEGQKLMMVLNCTSPVSKADLAEQMQIDTARLNELLLLLTENNVIEFVSDRRVSHISGYKISGHCGIAAYMVLAAMYILNKKKYTVSEYLAAE